MHQQKWCQLYLTIFIDLSLCQLNCFCSMETARQFYYQYNCMPILTRQDTISSLLQLSRYAPLGNTPLSRASTTDHYCSAASLQPPMSQYYQPASLASDMCHSLPFSPTTYPPYCRCHPLSYIYVSIYLLLTLLSLSKILPVLYLPAATFLFWTVQCQHLSIIP